MGTDVLLQLVLVLLTIFIFISIQHFPKQALTKLRSKSKTTAQSNRHFLNGAQLLSKARSTRNNKTTSINLAKHAVSEADKALSMSPKDPAAHILKALSLDLMGRRTSALKSLDAALSPPAVKSLTERERGDALVKRAEIVVAVGKRRRRVEEAVADLVEAVGLGCGESGKAWWLLGKCYEVKGMREEARKAFEEAVRVEPPGSGMSQAAREGLERLG